MHQFLALLELAKNTALEAAHILCSSENGVIGAVETVALSGRETKIAGDRILEAAILEKLAHTGISILTEESGYIDKKNQDGLLWIVDPLDGSVNFSRGFGPCAISIALWKDMKPYFGVIYSLEEKCLAWGGVEFGAWLDSYPISVSNKAKKCESILCTGIPARFDLANVSMVKKFTETIFSFSKVRMIGSAAVSLLLVARGVIDAYYEEDIMLWDVAAGVAIVEGATGKSYLNFKKGKYQCLLKASNHILIDEI